MRRFAAALLFGTIACGGAPTSEEPPAPPDEACDDAREPLDFGTMLVGQSGVTGLSITNSSDEVLRIRVEEAGPSFRLSPDFVEIPPGATGAFTVTFSPTETGPVGATLIFERTCGTTEQLLIGTGIEPSFSCDATALDFGDVPVGSELRRTVTCTNLTALELALSLGGVGCDDCIEEFLIEPSSVARDGLRIPASGKASFEVIFVPAEEGESYSSATLYNGTEKHHVELMGTGIADPGVASD